nr:uncharacterized protein LOC128694108 [Cherax quadricarinatus]
MVMMMVVMMVVMVVIVDNCDTESEALSLGLKFATGIRKPKCELDTVIKNHDFGDSEFNKGFMQGLIAAAASEPSRPVIPRAAGDLLRGVDVPQFAFAGGQANLTCSYDLRSTRLYSLKWYHNGTEFYRYVPTERNTPINIKPSHKFSVTEVFRNEHRVMLSLTRLTVSASGDYRCEVIAEHPSFRTETSNAPMTVLRDTLSPPVLVGAREIYEPTERIKIGCQPKQPLYDGHTPTLQWFIEGTQSKKKLQNTADKLKATGPGSVSHWAPAKRSQTLCKPINIISKPLETFTSKGT